jgi:hypothetical protein
VRVAVAAASEVTVVAAVTVAAGAYSLSVAGLMEKLTVLLIGGLTGGLRGKRLAAGCCMRRGRVREGRDAERQTSRM